MNGERRTATYSKRPGVELTNLNRELSHFRLEALDVVDVVVSKLKRLHGNDLRDTDELTKCVERLHRVERYLFGVPETEIDLPDWLTA